jgi:AcrR family transcriptional regulator
MHTDREALLDLGARVRAARNERGLSLRELGRLCHVSAASLSLLESGKAVPGRERLATIGAVLGLDLEHPREAMHRLPGFTDWREYGPLGLHPVLMASLETFVETGYHGATMRMIADRCELSTPTLYYHYPSKQAILTTLLDLGMKDLLARTAAARADGRDALERFCFLIESLVLYHAHRQALAFLGATEVRALTPEHREHHITQRDAQQRMVDDELIAAVRAGQATVEDAKGVARAVVTMCTAVADWYRPHGPKAPSELAREYVDLARRLIGANGGRPRRR